MTAAADLTADQQEAADAFAAWLKQPVDGTPFVLSGFAGSGKTFLSMRLLRQVEASGLCWTVVAPTHKAVGVLRQALELEGLQPTWYPSTIHRLLRLKLKRSADAELCEPTEQTAMALENLGLVLIDEASMVDSTLLGIALQCAHPFKTRLVFVGDPAQLPPVGEPNSPVFAMQRSCSASLTQVVRHQGPVLQLAAGLREGRLPCQMPPLLPPIRSPQGQVRSLVQREWLDQARRALRDASVQDNPDAARILCYTNRTLDRLVPHARRAIHGEMADQMPVLPGEVLISRTAVMAPASRDGEEAGEEPDMVLGSNREVTVRDVKPEACDLADFGLSSADGPVPVIETLSASVNAGDLELTLRLQPPIGSAGRQELDAVMQRLRKQARDAGKKNGRAIWRQYFLIRDAFASLGPAAVLTVHRSQGSSFGDVFVAPDVFRADPAIRQQLCYGRVPCPHGGLVARPCPPASPARTGPTTSSPRQQGRFARRRDVASDLRGTSLAAANSTPRGIAPPGSRIFGEDQVVSECAGSATARPIAAKRSTAPLQARHPAAKSHNAEQGSPEGFVFGVEDHRQLLSSQTCQAAATAAERFASCAIWQQFRPDPGFRHGPCSGAMDRAVQRPQRFVVVHAGHNAVAAPQHQRMVQIGLAAADVGLHRPRLR